MKGTGRDGVVDIRPLRMDSSYEPTNEPKSSEPAVPTEDILLVRDRGNPEPSDSPLASV
jgi:hypothetical protein